MAKLQRKDVKIFASNPNHQTQVTTFLTAVDPTPDYSNDPNAIQNEYYPKGWLAKGNDDLPQGEDLNGVLFAESYKNAYLYQMGIAEWNATDEYCENSFCQINGVIYKSLINSNTGNNPTTDDGTKWKEIPLDPYTGENLGTAEGVYAGKTLNNELQFKSIAVSGNGNITSSDDTITIAIGGGGTGDVYWGAIDGTLSNQSDLQQALNLKQNLIGYTPENVTNKVTTVRTSSVATDTAYASEKATRTAIDNAIIEANDYTDYALTNLSTNAFVLYANSWIDINTGTLTTTAPTGTGFPHRIRLSEPNLYEDIANFTYTTTQETKFNNTFTYNVLMPIRNVRPKKWSFKFKLSIQHQDVNNGLEFQIFQTDDLEFIVDLLDNLNFQFRQDLINISEITYPAGSTIKLNIKAKSKPDTGETSNYDFDLLVYDEQYPLVISRNKGINKFYSTSLITQTLGDELNQESFNTYIYNAIQAKQDKIQGVQFYYDDSIIKQEPNTNRTSYLGSDLKPYNYIYGEQIGDSTEPVTRAYISRINSTSQIPINSFAGFARIGSTYASTSFLTINGTTFSSLSRMSVYEDDFNFNSIIGVSNLYGNTYTCGCDDITITATHTDTKCVANCSFTLPRIRYTLSQSSTQIDTNINLYLSVVDTTSSTTNAIQECQIYKGMILKVTTTPPEAVWQEEVYTGSFNDVVTLTEDHTYRIKAYFTIGFAGGSQYLTIQAIGGVTRKGNLVLQKIES